MASTGEFIERLGREVRRRRQEADLTVQAQADPRGSEELILVTAGTLVVDIEGRSAEPAAGASARPASDRPYAYTAPDGPVFFARVVELGRHQA